MNRADRLALVDHDDPVLPIAAQCRLLKVARSTLYYRPVSASADDLAVMRRIDELHLEYPFYSYCVTHSARRTSDASVHSKDIAAVRAPKFARGGYARLRLSSACGVANAAGDPLGR